MRPRTRVTVQDLLTERRRGIERGDTRQANRADTALWQLQRRLEAAKIAQRRHKLKRQQGR